MQEVVSSNLIGSIRDIAYPLGSGRRPESAGGSAWMVNKLEIDRSVGQFSGKHLE
jgi:hypothetical protein